MQWQKYILAFVITTAIFGTAFYVTSRLDARRVADIRATQEAISIDILSLETQFDLLGSLGCETITEGVVLSSELNTLAARLSVAENNLGSDNEEVISLKKQYSLLEIKDYLLMREISGKCPAFKPVSILYFYSNTENCEDCRRMGEVLSYLRNEYPDLRVYSFDYNLNLSALETLISLRRVEPKFPALIVNSGRPSYGFKSVDAMYEFIPELKTLPRAESLLDLQSATSTEE